MSMSQFATTEDYLKSRVKELESEHVELINALERMTEYTMLGDEDEYVLKARALISKYRANQ